ncbi:MAG: hydroxymethylglutaryl-CoA reductase, degradative [Deltaproteobacteria bacterium]|nr:hydroxymethylglutaryl-CoA reductase, degradative [Deltaproteobacteria bacterium]
MVERRTVSSRISGFYRKPLNNRVEIITGNGLLSEESKAHLDGGGYLDPTVADRLSENVIGCHSLPLAVALNFRINGRDVLVPMAVEEPSIVAAASNAARLVRLSGGFFAEATPPVMTTQVQLDEVPEPHLAAERLLQDRDELLRLADQAIPNMVRRGGGCRDLEVRVLDEDEGLLVVHLYVEVGDAMGANLVDSVAEVIAPQIQSRIGGRIGLRILTNLPLRRTVKVTARVSTQAVGGEEMAHGILRASRFASLDVFRAVTHNKGIMNGIDAVAVATGQDWRSIEAGAHAFAAFGGQYKPLATWKRVEDSVEGTLELPMAVGTVGGSTRVHPGVRAAFELLQLDRAGELAEVIAAAGLASNLAALRALAGEGIQRGHMRLHHRKATLFAETESAAVANQAEGEFR